MQICYNNDRNSFRKAVFTVKLTILTDNTTRIDAYYLGEPAVSYFIECDGMKFLFDTGYSDVYLKNAERIGIDLHQLDAIIFSHGHNDHTGGLEFLPEAIRDIPLYAHPDAFAPKEYEGMSVGSIISETDLCNRFQLCLSSEPVRLSEHLIFLGEIPRTNDFEGKAPIGMRLLGKAWEPDYLPDDTALAYCGNGGLTIITGCSHAGICNITEYAKDVCGDDRIEGIIGGFHLLEMNSQVSSTVDYLKKQNPKRLCPCHCTCFHARAALQNAIPVTEVCVGDVLEIE